MTMTDTFPALLRWAGRTFPDKVFLHTTSASGRPEEVTFSGLDLRSREIAAGLLRRGIRPGDRVAVAAPNQVEWLELFHAVTCIGAVLVTLNVRYREAELGYMLGQSGARMVVTSATEDGFDFEGFYAGFRDEIPGVEEVIFLGRDGDDGFEALRTQPDGTEIDSLAEAVEPGDPALILYTSGTTGRPKGAVLTHRSIMASARGQVERLGTTAEDVYLCVMPLNHVGGITCSVTSALLTASSLVLPRAFSPAKALADLEGHRVTLFAGVPTMWSLMLSHPDFASTDTRTLRTVVIGGSNVEPTLARQILDGFPGAALSNLYGLSESSGAAVMSAPGDSVETVSRTLGTPLGGTEARVMGPDGPVVTAGEQGELQLRGAGVAAGYWGQRDESAQTFLDDGWLRTGDMVTMEPDGHVVMHGRLKEMFVQGGYNVYPVEVENVLTSHPAVAMAAGVGIPDRVLGEVGLYCVVLRPDEQVTEEELREYCRARVADYKVPRSIELVAELPTTPSGKVAKAALRERYTTQG